MLSKSKAKRGRRTSSEASHLGLRVLFAGLLLLGMGQSLFFVVLPPIAREIGLSELETAVIFSLSAVAWVFCAPFWGRRSDFWGRRLVMVIGLSGFAVSTLLMAVVLFARLENLLPAILALPLLMVARSIFGIFGSGTMPAAQAYMADRTTPAKRAKGASMLMASFGVGNIIGPAFAAGLVIFGFLTPFVFIGTLGLLAAMAIFLLVPTRYRRDFRKKQDKKLKILSPPLRPFVVMGVFSSYALAVLVQLSTFYFIDRLDLAPSEATQMVGVGLTVMALATLFAQFVIIQKFEPSVRSLLRYSGWVMMAAFLGLSLSASYGLMVLCLGLAGLGFGLMRPALMAAASLAVGRRHQGSAAGAINSTAAVGHAINPFTGALLYSYYQPAPFLLVAACMGCFLLMAYAHPQVRRLGQKGLASEPPIPAPHLAADLSQESTATPAPIRKKRKPAKKTPTKKILAKKPPAQKIKAKKN